MAERRIFKLLLPSDIVQQAGGDQDVVIHIFQCPYDTMAISEVSEEPYCTCRAKTDQKNTRLM